MKFRVVITKEYYENLGERQPWYIGYSYTNYDTRSIIFLIIPINIVVALYLYLSDLIKWKLVFYLNNKRKKINDKNLTK